MDKEIDHRGLDDLTLLDDGRLIDEALVLLPEIGKCLFASIMHHPRLAGSSVPQVKALGLLSHRAPCTVGELANGLGVAMATASEAVDRLVERALVVRQVNPADRRQVLLDLTEQGRSLTDEMRIVRRGQLRQAFARLAPKDRAVFVDALRVLAEVLRDEVGATPGTSAAERFLERPDPGEATIPAARLARATPAPVGTG